ncbi:protein toll-like [Diorhabda sublineata]|uniref:protein toll-like n=1 Tax=Diorhabda sublineata TaxID=1163346 RepID=UPI0024E04C97|nr:protein toll-like [Diorhabda sublineata]
MALSIFLFTLFVAVQEVISTSQCDNNNSTQCLCLYAEDYEYQCPRSYTNILIRAMPENYLNIDCYDMETFDINLLPNYTSGHTNSLTIRYCPLPQDNFLPMLDRFDVKNVAQFKLDNNTSTEDSITKKIFYGLEDLSILTLFHMGIKLEDDILEYLPKLSQLYMENSEITDLDSFKFPTGLKVLHITGNLLNEVPQGVFQNLTELKQLHLWNNRITRIRGKDFTGLKRLKSLELSMNRISTIEEDSFAELIELKTINLRANDIRRVNKTLFENNKNLTSIRMEDNPNLILPEGLFSNLENLTNVNIKNSGIENIPGNIFENSTKIIYLYMQKNRFETIPKNLFWKLSQLKKLDLSHNKLNTLDDDIFNDLSNLEYLNLDYNNISYISEDLFRNTRNLATLSMKYNKISDIHIEAFLWLKNLIQLDLSNNVYEANYIDGASPFARCDAVKSLSLSHNLITKFPSVLVGMRNVEEIRLNYNKILTIQVIEVTSALSSKLRVVDLSNNEIGDVDFEGVEYQSELNMRQLDAYHNDERQLILYLSGNPLKCDCGNYDLVRYIKNDMTPAVKAKIDINVDNTECVEPYTYRGYQITDLKPNDITCQGIVQCPKECQCFWRPYTDYIEIDCTNRNLTQFPNLQIPKKQISINLDGNYIQGGLRPGLGYENVKILILSNNRVRGLNWIPQGIEILKLNGNELTNISSELLEMMNSRMNLTLIQLSDNPWDCGCEAIDLQTFMKDHYRKVNPNDVICKEDSKLLIEKTDLCSKSTKFILMTVLPILTFLLLTTITLIFYIQYRQEVKIWLFSKNLCLWFVTEEEIDEDKIYDVFISYSNKDQEFVMQNLLPVLESGPRPFKTCIHDRDWEPGEMILTHIANSVRNSRRTLVVLSNNFLDSVWGIHEFKTAHTQAVKEGRARVVVIKYSELDEGRLDEDIRAYLNTNTYVEWGKPWFWNKLKYALPHLRTRGFYESNQRRVNMMLKIDGKFDSAESPPPVILSPALLDDRVSKYGDVGISCPETPLVRKT